MYILSKFITILLNPLLWIIIIFLWGLFTKAETRKKKCFATALIMLFFFSNPYIIKKLILAYQPEKYNMQKGEVYNAGIVLGGFAGMNKSDHKTYFNNSADRFLQTALLYKQGHIKKIIIAAGDASIINKNDFREADFAQNQFIQIGIPATDIFVDRNSRNTVENAVNAKKIIDSLGWVGPYLLITSALHMPRSEKTFSKAGLNIKPYPCAYSVTPFEKYAIDDYLIPSAGALRDWNFYLKEVVGLLRL
ncbi:MAG: YdcF family protein [Chitinophagaceae bacterium]|nr:YdcF family protein [Chitinophagaceae bacterium]